ncbi:malate dehydrogenase [Crocosphaera chwakensis]|uniref:Malate dehydrogenase n=1 Tax=Crocosphaera chwakensis CCY0110 TaxID=391612 RepID=A3IMN3_9CHRO|nr:malate dehydrogenase [Crocosphaera chwakensis]EAZ92136.1 2-ketoacid dehydrogenase; malate dehydrogenase; lactate dehydrogenase [Crocosphaera chwakensis CCY0110]
MTVSYDSLLPCQSLRVAIIGAGNVGRTLAQRIVEKDLADVVLLDVVEGLPQGIALDLMEAQGLEYHNCEVVGTNNYEETAGADLVVITAGRARTPGISRDDLLAINAKIVADVAEKAYKYSPNAIFMVITNPLDVMTYLTRKVTGLPPQRVMGMAGVLDSSRLQTFIAMELGISTANVTAMVLGGHGDLMVPLPNYCTVNGIPITELLDSPTINRLIERTRNGGAEVVKLLKTGGAYYAPASAAYIMIESILRDQSRLLPTAAYLQGEYGLNDIYIGVPCFLSCRGVKKILEIKLSNNEQEALHISANSVRKNVHFALESVGIK